MYYNLNKMFFLFPDFDRNIYSINTKVYNFYNKKCNLLLVHKYLTSLDAISSAGERLASTKTGSD